MFEVFFNLWPTIDCQSISNQAEAMKIDISFAESKSENSRDRLVLVWPRSVTLFCDHDRSLSDPSPGNKTAQPAATIAPVAACTWYSGITTLSYTFYIFLFYMLLCLTFLSIYIFYFILIFCLCFDHSSNTKHQQPGLMAMCGINLGSIASAPDKPSATPATLAFPSRSSEVRTQQDLQYFRTSTTI